MDARNRRVPGGLSPGHRPRRGIRRATRPVSRRRCGTHPRRAAAPARYQCGGFGRRTP